MGVDVPSPAARAVRDETEAAHAAVATSAVATTTALPQAQSLHPPGWHGACQQTTTGATHTVAIDPPAGTVDATAYLMPLRDEFDAVAGWSVRIHNRRQRVDFPLYTTGGIYTAVFAGVDDAVTAAVTALRAETVPTPASGRSRPQ